MKCTNYVKKISTINRHTSIFNILIKLMKKIIKIRNQIYIIRNQLYISCRELYISQYFFTSYKIAKIMIRETAIDLLVFQAAVPSFFV